MIKLIIANKRYSSWSLRPWIFLRQFDVSFEEVLLDMGKPEFGTFLAKHMSNRKVPLLIDDGLEVWDSLAIIEYVNENYLAGKGWPADKKARAVARSVSAEMHSSFSALRQECGHDVSREHVPKDVSAQCLKDVERINQIWEYCRKNYGKGGPFLFGAFSAADAMFAPVVNRIVSYDLKTGDTAKDYIKAVRAIPAHQEFIADGKKEPILADHV